MRSSAIETIPSQARVGSEILRGAGAGVDRARMAALDHEQAYTALASNFRLYEPIVVKAVFECVS